MPYHDPVKLDLPSRAELEVQLAKVRAKMIAYPIATFVVGILVGAFFF